MQSQENPTTKTLKICHEIESATLFSNHSARTMDEEKKKGKVYHRDTENSEKRKLLDQRISLCPPCLCGEILMT
ncbi:hypothetical protein ACFL2Q_20290, partial [Thermodesulfobacteriota bacterium]